MQFKKILAFLLAAVLILSVFTVSVGAESVEIFEVGVTAEPTIPVSSSPVIYNAGEDVTVTISADQNTGFDFLWLKVSYDPAALEYVDYTTNTLFGNEAFSVKSGYLTFAAILNRVSTATGDMFKINFKIKDDFCGDAEIVASLVKNDEANCKNGDANVPFVGDKAFVTAHAYDNACDAECNVCNQTRTVPDHIYDNDCDAECNICKQTRTVAAHVYDNACDTNCNICNAARTVTHKYSSDLDIDCDICSQKRIITGITGDCTWTLDGTVLTISGNGSMANYNASSTPWGNDSKTITKVLIGTGVTNIGDFAFYKCYSLKEVTIGNSVINIGSYAFEKCYFLTSVTIGNSVTNIGNGAFSYCEKLTNVKVPDSVKNIGNYAFDDCTSLTNVTIGNNVTNIGDGAFSCCWNLANVTMGNSVTNIGNGAFSNCPLKNITIPNSVTTIEDDAFLNCSISAVCITDIAVWCNIDFGFYSSNPLYFAENLYLNGNLVTNLVIPKSVTSIGDWAFIGYDRLTTVIIPDSVTSIGDFAFSECTNLKSIVIPNSVKNIGSDICYGCYALETVYYCGLKNDWDNIQIDSSNDALYRATRYYHYYDNACDTDCNICGATRTVKHVYNNDCDIECNVCGNLRLTDEHKYDWVTDKQADCGNNGMKHEECTICHVKRNENTVIPATGNHVYDNACDAECNVCNQTRTVPDHVYDNACDIDCNICSQIRTVPDHIYDNNCDTDCNVCGDIRDITHNYEWIVDKSENCGIDGSKHEECTVCHVKRNENTVISATGNHTYDNTCDTTCNVCEQIRSVPDHVYDNACDTDCNICDATRTITHDYEWVIDKIENCGVNGVKHEECTVCHVKRNENTVIAATGDHIYDNDCDKVCNVCGNIRLTDEHKYDWVIDKQADCGNNGTKHGECSVCGVKQFENTIILATGNHTYDNACDAECNVCKQIRAVPNHVYDNACDIDCNICGTTRTITHNYAWVVDKEENCGLNGSKHEECTVCHAKRNENTVITATGYHVFDNGCDTSCNICGLTRTVPHSYTTTTTKATTSKNGSIVKKCTKCGYVASKTTLKYAKTFKLSTTSYTYSGSAKKPTVKVYNSDGKLITSANYTVTYKNNKYVGKATVTVTFKKYYTGTKTLTFTINPKSTSISKLTAAKNSLKVSIKKQSSQVTGYQVQYSTSKSFTSATTKTISSYKTTSYTIKSLKAKKTYYVRVRTYKTVNGKKYYSGWSTYKYVKTK